MRGIAGNFHGHLIRARRTCEICAHSFMVPDTSKCDARKRKPFVLSLLVLPHLFVKAFTGFVLFLSFFPIYLVCALTSTIILHSCFIKEKPNGLWYATLLLPRWFIGHFSLFLCVLPSFLLYYATNQWTINEPFWIQIVTIASLMAVNWAGIFIGIRYLQAVATAYNLPWINWKLYFKSILDSYMDLITAIGVGVIIICLFQLKSLITWNPNSPKSTPFRTFVFIQFLLTILDITCIIPGVILIWFPWRLFQIYSSEKNKKKLFRQYQHNNDTNGGIIATLRSEKWKPQLHTRAIILEQFVQALIDIPYVLLTLIILLSGWRAKILWESVRNETDSSLTVRSKIVRQFVEWIFDVPCLVLSLLLLCSGLKTFAMLEIFWNVSKEGSKRWRIAEQLLCFFLDIFSLICLPMLLISVWYYKPSVRILREYRFYGFGYHENLRWNQKVFFCLVEFLGNLPFIIMSCIIYITYIHRKTLTTNFLWEENKRNRVLTLELFLCLLLDPFCFILRIIIFLLYFNYHSMKEEVRKYPECLAHPFVQGNRFSRRLLHFHYAWKSLCSFHYNMMFLLIIGTVYRARKVYKKRRFVITQAKLSPAQGDTFTKLLLYDQTICIVLEIPMLLSVCVIYILQWKWEKLQHSLLHHYSTMETLSVIEKETGSHKRYMLIISHVPGALQDAPFIFCFLFIACTYYRYETLINEHEESKKQSKNELEVEGRWNKKVFFTFFLLLLDPLLVLFSFFIFLVNFHFKDFYLSLQQAKGLEAFRLSARYFVYSFQDMPFALLLFILYITRWRLHTYHEYISHQPVLEGNRGRKRINVLKLISLLFLDVVALFSTHIVLYTIWNRSKMLFLLERLKQEDTVDLLLEIKFSQFCLLLRTLLDLPFILASILLFCSWRYKKFYQNVCGVLESGRKRKIVFFHFCCLLLDLPALCASIIVYCTFWRRRKLRIGLRNIGVARRAQEWHEISKLLFSIQIALESLFDLPFTCMVLLICLSWRWPDCMDIVRLGEEKHKKRAICFLFAVTLLDGPYIVCYYFIYIMKWYIIPYEKCIGRIVGKQGKNSFFQDLWRRTLHEHSITIQCGIITIFDIPTIFVMLMVTLLSKRGKTLKKLRDAKETSRSELRYACWKLFMFMIMDFMILVMGEFLVISRWRKKEKEKFIKNLNLSTLDSFLGLLYHSLCIISIDIPFMIMASLILITWRRNNFLQQFQFASSYDHFRAVTSYHFLAILFDLLCLPFLLFIVAGSLFLRSKNLISFLYGYYKDVLTLEHSKSIPSEYLYRIHVQILIESLLTAIDFFFFLTTTILFLFHWRWLTATAQTCIYQNSIEENEGKEVSPSEEAVRKLRNKSKCKALELHAFCLLLLDIIVIIPFLLCMISWRCSLLLRDLKEDWKTLSFFPPHIESNIRIYGISQHYIIIYHMLEAFLDIPFVILFCFLFWRLPTTLFHLWKVSHVKSISVRIYIFEQWWCSVVDAPVILVFLFNFFFFWKWKRIIASVYYCPNTSKERYKITFILCRSGIHDVIHFPTFLLLALTLWKIPVLYDILRKNNLFLIRGPSKEDSMVFRKEGGELPIHRQLYDERTAWMKDLLVLPCIPLLLLSPYRLYLFLVFVYGIESLTNQCKQVKHHKKVLRTWNFSNIIINRIRLYKKTEKNAARFYSACRIILLSCAIMAFEDLFVILSSLLCLLSGWRTISFLEALYLEPSKKSVFHHFRLLLTDIRMMFHCIVIVFFLVRVPQLLKRIYYVWKEAKSKQDRIFFVPFYFYWFWNLFVAKEEVEDLSLLEALPDELLFEISRHLQVKDICTLQQTCKQFSWLDDQVLWQEKLEELVPLERIAANIPYKEQLKYLVLEQQDAAITWNQRFCYQQGCKEICKELAIVSVGEAEHSFFLPFKGFYLLSSFLRQILFVLGIPLFPLLDETFWDAHSLHCQLEAFTFLLAFGAWMIRSLFCLFVLVYWRVGTLGSIYFDPERNYFLFRVVRVVLYIPFLLCLFLPFFLVLYLFQDFRIAIPVQLFVFKYYKTISYPVEADFASEEAEAFFLYCKNYWQSRESSFSVYYRQLKGFLRKVWRMVISRLDMLMSWTSSVTSVLYQCVLLIYNTCFGFGCMVSALLTYVGSFCGRWIYNFIIRLFAIVASLLHISWNVIKSGMKNMVRAVQFLFDVFLLAYNWYITLLVQSTIFCASCSPMIGNTLLLPVAVVWIFWPVCISLYFTYFLLFPCGLISAFLLQRGYQIIDYNWK